MIMGDSRAESQNGVRKSVVRVLIDCANTVITGLDTGVQRVVRNIIIRTDLIEHVFNIKAIPVLMYRYCSGGLPPFRDGTTHVIFEPLDFIARLAAFGAQAWGEPNPVSLRVCTQ